MTSESDEDIHLTVKGRRLSGDYLIQNMSDKRELEEYTWHNGRDSEI